MFDLCRARWKNRLLAWVPWLSLLNETRHLLQARRRWRRDGWTVPPPCFVRRAMLLAEARAVGAEILVETGTFLGDTTWAERKNFRRIYTVEVEPALAALARERFKGCPSVTLVEGDSATALPGICRELDGPSLFFLDGHYSGGFTGMGSKECPVLEELRAIFLHTTHPFRIVIDDARLFGTNPSYPDLATLEGCLAEQGGKMSMRVENDAILIW